MDFYEIMLQQKLAGKSQSDTIPWDDILPTDTASGTIASFPDGTDLLPAKSVSVALEPIQEGSGTPSPSNIRPISGRTECVSNVSGHNLFSGEYDVMYKLPQPIPKGTYVTASAKGATRIVYYDENQNQIDYWSVQDQDPNDSTRCYRTFCVSQFRTEDAYYIKFTLNEATDLQFEIAESASSLPSPYEAPTTYTTTLGRTVYGGTLDVVSGELVVDRAIVDLGTINFTYDTSGKRWQKAISDIYNYPTRNGNLVAEKYVADITATSGDEGKMFTVSKALYIYSTDGTTPPSGNLVYPIENPQTYQLTAQDIALLKGNNNVWSDGSVSVEYYADVQKWVEKKLG